MRKDERAPRRAGKAIAAMMLGAGAVAAALPAAAAAVGELDPGFHGNGLRTLPLGGAGASDLANAVHVLSDRRILLAGVTRRGTASGDTGFVTRLEADGSIDFGFGTGGTTLVDFGGEEPTEDSIRALAVDAHGRIVVAGSSYRAGDGHADFAVARLLPDGALDAAFANGGVAVIDFVDDSSIEGVIAVAVQPDGAIALAGASQVTADEVALVVLRLLDGGGLDTRFSTDGKAAFALGGGIPSASAASSIAVLPDGRLLLGGLANTATDGSFNLDLLLLQLLPDGSRDPAFGADGAALLGLDRGGSNTERAFDMALQEDGRIVLAGASAKAGEDFDMVLAGFLADGRLDTGFGDGGVRVLELDRGGGDNDIAHAVVVLSDGSLMVAGTSNAPVGEPSAVNDDIALVILGGDGLGALDEGLRVYALDLGAEGARDDSVQAAALAADGAVVLAGATEGSGDGGGSVLGALVMRVLGAGVFRSGFED